MAIQHADISDPYVHEPKGMSGAAQDTVYIANGAGSGNWQQVGIAALDTTSVYADIQTELDTGEMPVSGRLFLTGVLENVSEPSNVIVPLIADCTVVGVSFVLGGAIDVDNALVSIKSSSGGALGSPVTVGFSGSSKGDQYNFTASANNVITGPSWIEIETDGGSTDAAPLFFTIEIEYAINNTL